METATETATTATITVLPGQQALPGVAGGEAAPAAPAKTNGAPKPQQGKPKVKTISIPQSAFISRVRREASAEIQKRLGISLEEAEKIVKAAGEKPTTNGTQGNGHASIDQAVKTAMAETEKHRKATDLLKRQLEEAKRNHQKVSQRLKDKAVETELRYEAASAGIRDPDYALHLFARAAARGETAEPKAFFAGLRETHDHLFKEPTVPAPKPVPVPVAPNTAPPESKAQGEVTPTPKAAGTPAKAANADEMDNKQFNQHMRSQYGFTPGT